jgi:hypothetical protein
MALNEQILREQTDLGLTDAQITAIAALSQKDEDTVFPQKFGEMLGNMDTMIAAKSSIIRNEGEKTSDYMGRVLEQLKGAADEGATFKTANAELEATIAKLKDDIAKGTGNEQLKADLEKLRGDLASAKKVNNDLQDSLTKKEAEYKGKLEGFKMDSEIAAAMSGVTLKKELPESAKQALIDTAMQRVKGAKHVYDETAGAFIFQNEDGTPMKDTKLNNLTVGDMLTAELERMAAYSPTLILALRVKLLLAATVVPSSRRLLPVMSVVASATPALSTRTMILPVLTMPAVWRASSFAYLPMSTLFSS